LPSSNYGIVLDVSQDGVGFLASSPVDEAVTMRFEISARSTRGPEAAGELMWKDSTGKRGGLRFTDVPEDLRELLRDFLPRQRSGTAAPSNPMKPAFAPVLSAKIASKGESEMDPQTERRILGCDDIPDLPRFDATVSRIAPGNSKKWALFANGLTAALACVIAVAIWYSLNSSAHRRDALNALTHLERSGSAFISLQAERLQNGWPVPAKSAQSSPNARPALQQISVAPAKDSHIPAQAAPPIAKQAIPAQIVPAPAAPAPLATAPHPKADIPAKTSKTRASAQASSEATPAHTAIQNHAPSQIVESQAPLALARELPQQDAKPADQSKALQLLWQSVAKGNTSAELELADLYLTGRGVSKSCSQAFVLLTAAKIHKNVLAEQKLRNLPEYGCSSTSEPSSGEPPSSESNTRPGGTE
jgi:TPR repeat protein